MHGATRNGIHRKLTLSRLILENIYFIRFIFARRTPFRSIPLTLSFLPHTHAYATYIAAYDDFTAFMLCHSTCSLCSSRRKNIVSLKIINSETRYHSYLWFSRNRIRGSWDTTLQYLFVLETFVLLFSPFSFFEYIFLVHVFQLSRTLSVFRYIFLVNNKESSSCIKCNEIFPLNEITSPNCTILFKKILYLVPFIQSLVFIL